LHLHGPCRVEIRIEIAHLRQLETPRRSGSRRVYGMLCACAGVGCVRRCIWALARHRGGLGVSSTGRLAERWGPHPRRQTSLGYHFDVVLERAGRPRCRWPRMGDCRRGSAPAGTAPIHPQPSQTDDSALRIPQTHLVPELRGVSSWFLDSFIPPSARVWHTFWWQGPNQVRIRWTPDPDTPPGAV
jgi:hypothetical protein